MSGSQCTLHFSSCATYFVPTKATECPNRSEDTQRLLYCQKRARQPTKASGFVRAGERVQGNLPGFQKGAAAPFAHDFASAKSSVLCLPCRLTGKLAPPPYGRCGFERQENGVGFSSGQREKHDLFSARRVRHTVPLLINLSESPSLLVLRTFLSLLDFHA